MANRHDTSSYKSFEEVSERFDEIITDVRSKDTSLERSLDLFDEAIALGTRAIELVDRTDFSPAEKERLADVEASDAAAPEQQG
jgi:exonuclease VII small subunit